MALLSVPSNLYALNMQPSQANCSDTADDNSPSCYFVTYHGFVVSLCNKAAKKHCCHLLRMNSLCVTAAAVHAMEKLSGAFVADAEGPYWLHSLHRQISRYPTSAMYACACNVMQVAREKALPSTAGLHDKAYRHKDLT